ncbi:serine/threonine protein kinase [Candidatus Uabimicrobium sp. HlEnr_7]|uniref:serine/threonine protein kinase n=1 Tax=Candidatus Uabimicrobium helgolandensis TaxID=3095367 RepID=UPI0035589278
MKNHLLQDRYQLVSPIGSGGTGVVYIAFDMKTSQKVAIKKVQILCEDKLQSMQKEYNFLQRVEHINLVKAHQFFVVEDYAYIVLEYVYGKTLADILSKNKHSVCLISQLAIANQIARGVEVLNTGGIIHRDIKPQNIMLNIQTGEIKIVDLGIAKNAEDREALIDDITGTYAYMSPEQTRGKISWTTDIFSLGTVLYQFFIWGDTSPFETKNIYQTIERIQNYNPLDICSVLDFVHATNKQKQTYEQISQIVEKSLSKLPQFRWENAGIVADLFFDLHQKLLNDINDEPQNYKITTSRQISPQLQGMLHSMRNNYKSI